MSDAARTDGARFRLRASGYGTKPVRAGGGVDRRTFTTTRTWAEWYAEETAASC